MLLVIFIYLFFRQSKIKFFLRNYQHDRTRFSPNILFLFLVEENLLIKDDEPKYNKQVLSQDKENARTETTKMEPTTGMR